jgi:4-amino-4-deoxy-L-arabinose transferase-like glycosyltransferase
MGTIKTSREIAIVAGVTVLCLVPFVSKAFNMDEPLFVWSAKQIVSKPLDFYGFSVNWYGSVMPMSEVTKNPPAACYWSALVGALFGWREAVQHTAFIIWAIAAALGTYCLAKRMCSDAMLAALAAILTPVFLVSSTMVMCDTMMLAFWVWAVYFWVKGLEADSKRHLSVSAALITLSALTKYFGISLLVLLLAYSIMQKRKAGTWALYFLIPVVILAGYQWATYALYGRGLLWDAASYATELRWMNGGKLFSKALVGLSFTGGCIITAFFFVPFIRNRIFLAAPATAFILGLVAVMRVNSVEALKVSGVRWPFFLQLGVMAVAGLSILGIAAMDFWESRDAESLLLLLWVAGTFVFASFINWSVNGRSILPMAPAVGILLVRQIGRPTGEGYGRIVPRWMYLPLIGGMVLSILVCRSDYLLAQASRRAAEVISKRFETYAGGIWFQGHWGFQYYMEKEGAMALDQSEPVVGVGGIIVTPLNNTNTRSLSEETAQLGKVFEFKTCSWLTTMSPLLGAGFHSDMWGPLPYVIGRVEPETYYAFVAKYTEER